jgi:putative NADPH-quinone reductase
VRVLVLAFHADFETSRVNRAWAETAEGVADQVLRIDDGSYVPGAYREACEAADRIVFQQPMHWYGPPWTMKRWIDQEIAFGWAYGDRMALAGKEWMSAVTVGAPFEEYGPQGSRRYTLEEFLRPLERTAGFIGMLWIPPFLACGAGILSEQELADSCQAYRQSIRK